MVKCDKMHIIFLCLSSIIFKLYQIQNLMNLKYDRMAPRKTRRKHAKYMFSVIHIGRQLNKLLMF